MDANTANKYAPTQWGGVDLYDFTCPSGQTVQLRKLGLSGLLSAGLLDEMDSLGSLMETNAIKPATGKVPQDRKTKAPTKAQKAAEEAKGTDDMVQMLIKDPSKFQAMTRLMERLIPAVVVQPPIEQVWTSRTDGSLAKVPDEARTEGLIYADSVPFNDQMAIFGQAMSGTSAGEIAAFRDEAESGVVPVEDGGSVSLPSE